MNHNAPIAKTFDVEAIRADFPILAERPYGKPLAYLDNAASAQKPRQVLARLNHFYEHEYANVHRGLHYLANAATDAYRAKYRCVSGVVQGSRWQKECNAQTLESFKTYRPELVFPAVR